MIEQIPLKRLIRSKSNVRRVPCTDEEMEQLRASIASHGLKQNLVVWPTKTNSFQVVAGDRRFQALKQLKKEGQIDEDYLVNCEVLDPEIHNPEEISLTENLTRVDLHPADQYEVFARLFKKGKGLTIEQIAGRFGISTRAVEQRMRLGMLHPLLLENYRQDKINLETLMAFTLAGEDHERQIQCAQAVAKEHNGHISKYYVERYLVGQKPTAASGMVHFVGLENYEAAGGQVTRDLFFDEDERGIYIQEPDKLRQMALEKIEPERQRMLKQGWKWVEIFFDNAWEEVRKFDQLDPTSANNQHTKAEKAMLGVALSISYDGKIAHDRGLILPEDRNEVKKFVADRRKEEREKAAQEAAENEGDAAADEATEAVETDTKEPESDLGHDMPEYTHSSTADADPKKVAMKEAGLSQALTEDLQVFRTNILRWSITLDLARANDLLLYSVACSVFGSYSEDMPLDITCRTPRTDPPHVDLEPDAARSLFEKEVQHLKEANFRWLFGVEVYEGDVYVGLPAVSAQERWETFCALPEEEKLHLAGVCTAMMLHNQTGICHAGNREMEVIAQELNPPWSMFRPTRDNFFGRLSKAVLLDILDKLCSDKDPERVAMAGKMKKGEIADMLESMFADPKGEVLNLHEATQRRIVGWYPASFAPKKL